MMDLKILGVILVTGAISTLITYFVTNTTKRKGVAALEKKQEDTEKQVESLKVAMVFVVTRLGGNPRDMGLM